MTEAAQTIAAVRRFNRFYTPLIGALDRSFLGGPYTLTEMRVLYELAHADGLAPKAICETLGLDAGYVSRIVARFEREGLVARRLSAADRRSISLSLTDAGRAVFAEHEARQVAQVERMLAHLPAAGRERLTAAFEAARGLLSVDAAAAPALRPHQSGDMGWIIERHGVLYEREYGWRMEAMVARICADFLDRFDPEQERCWIAERAGQRLGSIFLVKDAEEEGCARIRLLLIEPEARGLGLGRRMVDEAVGFAREAGYRQVVLWTHAELTAARAIYARAGFTLERRWTHEEFGHPATGETWRLVF